MAETNFYLMVFPICEVVASRIEGKMRRNELNETDKLKYKFKVYSIHNSAMNYFSFLTV